MAKEKALAKRLMSSAVIVSVAAYMIFGAPLWLFICAVEVFAILALFEFFSMVEKKGILINKKLAILCGGALPLFVYYPGESIVIGATILAIFLVNFEKRDLHSITATAGITLLGIMYVSWFFSFLTKVRCLPDGRLWVFYLLLVVKAGDAAAYFVGTKFGRTKLLKHISPNKTIEGAVGGLIVSIALSFFSKAYLPNVAVTQLLLLGAILGVLAQLGDLVESLIKRDMGVKDSGAIPGLGGVLDVLDSILFTTPFLYYYLTVVLKVI